MNNTINSQLRGSSASAQYSSQFERGHSFAWRGKWTAGLTYTCDEFVTDFVTYNNTILVCRKTHVADGDNRPVIVGNDVQGNLWEIALQNNDSQSAGCCEEMGIRLQGIADNIADLNDRLQEIRDKMNVEPQHTVTYELRLSANKTQIETDEELQITATYIAITDGVPTSEVNVTGYADWTECIDGNFSKSTEGNYTVTATYSGKTASINITVTKKIVDRYLNVDVLSNNSIEVQWKNCSWVANPSENWVTLTPSSGDAGSNGNPRFAIINVSGNNPYYDQKNVVIYFYSEDVEDKRCTIRFDGKATPTITIGSFNQFAAENASMQSRTVTINNADSGTENNWTVEPNSSNGFTARKNGSALEISAADNPNSQSRSAQFTITYTYSGGTIPYYVNVSQEARSSTPEPPVTTNTIYYGFGPDAQYVYENGSHKEYNVNNIYSGTAPEEDYYFFVNIPSSLVAGAEYVSFTDGGFGCVMTNSNIELGGKQYVAYKLAALQQPGTTVRLKMEIMY